MLKKKRKKPDRSWKKYGAKASYRSIHTALLDEMAAANLSVNARLTNLALIVNLGPSGLEVRWPEALRAQLMAHTGLSAKKVDSALDELQTAHLVERDGPLVWAVELLGTDGSHPHHSPNHAKQIYQHVAHLPQLPIVQRFRERYAKWIATAEKAYEAARREAEANDETPSEGSGRGFDSPSEQREGSRKKRAASSETTTSTACAPSHTGTGDARLALPLRRAPSHRATHEEGKENHTSGASRSWLGPVADVWVAATGGTFPFGRAAKALAPLRDRGVTPDRMAGALCRYLDDVQPRYRSITRFAENFGEYDSERAPDAARSRAAELWALFKSEGFDTISGSGQWEERITQLADRGDIENPGEFRRMLGVIKPYQIAAKAQTTEWAVGEVLRRMHRAEREPPHDDAA